MEKYSTILFALTILFLVGLVILQLRIWTSKATFWARHKYTSTMLVFLLVAQTIMFFKIRENEKTRNEINQEIKIQIERLDNIGNALSDLQVFIDMQKRNLQVSEDRINTLNKEHEKLKPIIESERDIIDSILMLQESRNR